MKITSRKKIEVATEEYTGKRCGFTYTIRGSARIYNKINYGVAAIELTNGEFVEACFSSGLNVKNATNIIRDNHVGWLARAVKVGFATKKDKIKNVDLIFAASADVDELKLTKTDLTLGFYSVYGVTGKRGN